MNDLGDVVLLVGGDLLGTDRVMTAASAAGLEFSKTTPARLKDALTERPPLIVIVDLDGGREEAIAAVERARSDPALPARVVGYFSHIDTALADRAREAGIEALPRGRLWRSLEELFAKRPD